MSATASPPGGQKSLKTSQEGHALAVSSKGPAALLKWSLFLATAIEGWRSPIEPLIA